MPGTVKKQKLPVFQGQKVDSNVNFPPKFDLPMPF